MTAADPVVADAEAALRRSRRLVRAAFAGLGGRFASVLVAFLVTPVIVRGLGAEGYGVYATVTMMAGLLSFTDLGLGSGLVTRLAAAEGRGDVLLQRRLVSCALVTLGALAMVVATVGVVASRVVPWLSIFGHGAVAEGELRRTVLFFGLLLACGLPATIGQKVLLGLQEGTRASAWLLTATVASLCITAVVAAAGLSLSLVVVATMAPPVVLGAVQSVVLFRAKRRDLRPALRAVRFADLTGLVRVGGLFFVLNLAGAVAFRTDLLVVSTLLGPAAAAVFAVTLRVFSLVTVAAGAMCAQLWPAFGEALASGDHAWVRRVFFRAVVAVTAGCVPVLTLLVLFAQPLVRIWVGPSVEPPLGLVVAMACWVALQCVVQPVALLMNAAEVVRFQVVAASAMAVANVATSVVFAGWFGVAGPVWASVLTHAVLNAGPACVLVYRRFLRPRDAGLPPVPVAS